MVYLNLVIFLNIREKTGEKILVESNLNFPYGMRVDLFRRYYKGKLPVIPLHTYSSPQEIKNLTKNSQKIWVLLYEEGEREKWENYMRKHGRILGYKGFQWEIHVLKGIKESWKNWKKYASFLYHLYYWEKNE